MRLVTFSITEGERFGASIENKIVDLIEVERRMQTNSHEDFPHSMPHSMLEFLQGGEPARASVQTAIEYAQRNLKELSETMVARDAADVDFLPPVTRPSKIICIGQNYAEHIKEMGHEPPKYPLFFAKYANTLIGHKQAIKLPRVSTKVDYEAELVAVIGRRGKYIEEADALDYVAGYMNFNDVSVRDYQRRTTQFLQGKTFDTSGPCGAMLVTADEVKDPHNLTVTLRLNNETMQQGSTSDFIFSLPKIINYLSEIMTLEPGDMIATGTPPGVGAARTPPVFLKAGDTVEVEIEGLGVLSNSVEQD